MNVSISILTYNRAPILKELLESLCEISDYLHEIIVIDNFSEDGTSDMVRECFPKVSIYTMDSNVGVSARNVGMAKASGDIVLTLDDDILGIDSSAVIELKKIFSSDPDIGAVCFKVVDHYTGEICNWCHHYKKEEFSDRGFLTDEISEGAVAFRKTALDKSGLYPEDFFISYEGADLFCRLLESKYKTIYTPRIRVRHKHATQSRTSWRRYYYDTRNQIWFAVRNLPIPYAIRYLSIGLGAMLVYSIRDGFFKYWIKGVWDASKAVPEVWTQRKPLSNDSMQYIRGISKNRPGFIYMIKARLLQKSVKI